MAVLWYLNMQVETTTTLPPFMYFGENDPDNRPRTDSRLLASAAGHSAGTQHSADARIVILLAEDNLADAYLVEEALAEHEIPFTLHHVRDGEQAIGFIERAEADDSAPCPSLLLLDLNLPKRSGQQVLARVRQSKKCGNIPVIVVTSSQAATDREAVARLRADRFFRKPTNLEEFMEIGRVVKDVWDTHSKHEL